MSAGALVLAEAASPAARSAIAAARACVPPSAAVDLLLLGPAAPAAAAAASRWPSVRSVLVAATPSPPTASTAAPLLASVMAAARAPYSHVVAPAGALGRDVLPRAAGKLGLACLSDVVAVADADPAGYAHTYVRPVYAGNAVATVRVLAAVGAEAGAEAGKATTTFLTARTTAFEPIPASNDDDSPAAEVRELPDPAPDPRARFVAQTLSSSERPDLADAGVVVAGGRGLQSADNFRQLEALADAVGGAVGATRAAVDLGWVPNELQVGQTGKVVAPRLYFALGVSGAIQHLAGMKDSGTIVAINKDPDAPIFQVADYGLVADVLEVMPQLLDRLKTLPQKADVA